MKSGPIHGGGDDAVAGPREMDSVIPAPAKSKRRRFGIWIVIAVLVLYPEVAMTLYFLLCVILAVRMNWLVYQGLNDLRRRYRS